MERLDLAGLLLGGSGARGDLLAERLAGRRDLLELRLRVLELGGQRVGAFALLREASLDLLRGLPLGVELAGQPLDLREEALALL
ncbi:MAG: hypothetical protein U1G05_01160 [Kiritimatiellia bacterium]